MSNNNEKPLYLHADFDGDEPFPNSEIPRDLYEKLPSGVLVTPPNALVSSCNTCGKMTGGKHLIYRGKIYCEGFACGYAITNAAQQYDKAPNREDGGYITVKTKATS